MRDDVVQGADETRRLVYSNNNGRPNIDLPRSIKSLNIFEVLAISVTPSEDLEVKQSFKTAMATATLVGSTGLIVCSALSPSNGATRS